MFGRKMKLACVALTMAALGCAAPLAAQAQESKTTWRISRGGRRGWRFRRLRDGLPGCRILRKRSARTC